MEKIEVAGVHYVKAVEVESLASKSSRAFNINFGGSGGCDGFMVREEDNTLRAYINSCPHTGAPLNWTPDQFLTLSGQYIQCSIHGAMFKTENGECFAGPCGGQFLKPLDFVEQNGVVYIALKEVQKKPV
ncbi:MAG TPA: ferredoxin [Cycloclasticus sp.]|nr:ferredoxin [Cycloclasticus sp.]HIL92283.1 ferredoxin [Cycloclasticus sp.]